MFFSTLALLKNRNPVVEQNQILKNAVIESAIIHARNLCCIFLSVPSRTGDDILLRELTIRRKRDAGRVKLITLLEKAFFRDPMNGNTVFDAFSKRVTHAVDRKADADSYNYAAEFVAINGLIKAIVENLEATLEAAGHLTIDAASEAVSRLRTLQRRPSLRSQKQPSQLSSRRMEKPQRCWFSRGCSPEQSATFVALPNASQSRD
jgi:hypothetical protein